VLKEKAVEVVGIVAAGAMLVLFCACAVVMIVRREHLRAVLALVGALLFGILALEQKDPEILRAAADFVKSFFD